MANIFHSGEPAAVEVVMSSGVEGDVGEPPLVEDGENAKGKDGIEKGGVVCNRVDRIGGWRQRGRGGGSVCNRSMHMTGLKPGRP